MVKKPTSHTATRVESGDHAESPPTPVRRELPDDVAVRVGDHHLSS